MIFLAAEDRPTVFLMLTESDCNDMRDGRTKFVDPGVTGGRGFNAVVLSLHKDQREIEETLRRAGHGALLGGMPSPVPQPREATCDGCESIVPEASLLDGMCIACWRERARAGGYKLH